MTRLADPVPALPARFNLCTYFLDHNVEEGRGAKVALRAGDETRTFAEVSAGAARVAAALRRCGVRPEERVLIVLPDRFEFAEAARIFGQALEIDPADGPSALYVDRCEEFAANPPEDLVHRA